MKNDRIIDANNVNVKILIHILLLCDSETIYMKEIIKPPIRKIKTKKENHDTISIKKIIKEVVIIIKNKYINNNNTIFNSSKKRKEKKTISQANIEF